MKIFYTKMQNDMCAKTFYEVRKSKYDAKCYDIYKAEVNWIDNVKRFKAYNMAFLTLQSAIDYLNI